MNMDFEKIVLLHAEKYPLMQAQDFVKLAYQAAFGCGHMVKGTENALLRVQSERNNTYAVFAEDIGNGYVPVGRRISSVRRNGGAHVCIKRRSRL